MILDTFFLIIIILCQSLKQFLVVLNIFKQFQTFSNNFNFHIFQENLIINKLLLLITINNYLTASLL